MKKLLVILTVLFIAPLTVNAYTINTDFDESKCELTVSGTQEGHDANVTLFLSNTDPKEFKGMQTGAIENGNFSVSFVLKSDQGLTLDIVVANENGDNKTTKLNEEIPACTIVHENNNNQGEQGGQGENPANPPETHLVHFNTNGGTVIGDVEIAHEDLVERPQQDPEKNGFTFGGWFENQELTRPFDFNRGIIEETTIYARWIENNNLEDYDVEDAAGNIISFTEETGLTFDLSIIDMLTLTPEQFAQATGQPASSFGALKEALGDMLKQHGNMLAIYGIELTLIDPNDPNNNRAVHDGPFQIKIKITDEMKKYDTFKLVFLDTDANDNIILGDVVTLTVEGDYLVGTLNHLSTYALTGSTTPESPKTYDNVNDYTKLLVISLLGLSIGVIGFVKTGKKHS